MRSVRPGEAEGRAECVRRPRLQRVGGRRVDARGAARTLAAVLAGSGRYRHRAGRQRPYSTRTCVGLARDTSGGGAWRPRRVNLHRRVCAGRDRRPRRTSRNDALARRRRTGSPSSLD